MLSWMELRNGYPSSAEKIHNGPDRLPWLMCGGHIDLRLEMGVF